jgi:drug/metabolite transporter (DMT)-like permease
MVSSVLLIIVAQTKGSTIISSMRGCEGKAWYSSGTAYFFGQFFTVAALASSSPCLVFAVKAMEPLSTALLAIPTLGQEFSGRLFVGLVVACCGIALVSVGTFHEDSIKKTSGSAAMLIVGTVLLANFGFSTRACVVKKTFAQDVRPALEALGRITVAGLLTGMLPMLVLIAAAIQGSRSSSDSSIVVWTKALLSEFTAQLNAWVLVSMCFFSYQGASLLLLECLAVESHALLVASKHVFVAIVSSVLLGEGMSHTMVIGISVTAVGVLFYQIDPEPAGKGIFLPMSGKCSATTHEGTRLLPGVSLLLNAISGFLLVVGSLYICVIGFYGSRFMTGVAT